jgi:hypothetical protein
VKRLKPDAYMKGDGVSRVTGCTANAVCLHFDAGSP